VFPIKDNIPTDRFPFVTLALLIANVVVYLLAISHGGSLWSGPDTHEILKYGAIPYSLTHSGAHCAEFAQLLVHAHLRENPLEARQAFVRVEVGHRRQAFHALAGDDDRATT